MAAHFVRDGHSDVTLTFAVFYGCVVKIYQALLLSIEGTAGGAGTKKTNISLALMDWQYGITVDKFSNIPFIDTTEGFMSRRLFW